MKLTKKQKKIYSLIGGISGLIVGGWIIFYLKDMRGFIITIASLILIFFMGRK